MTIKEAKSYHSNMYAGVLTVCLYCSEVYSVRSSAYLWASFKCFFAVDLLSNSVAIWYALRCAPAGYGRDRQGSTGNEPKTTTRKDQKRVTVVSKISHDRL